MRWGANKKEIYVHTLVWDRVINCAHRNIRCPIWEFPSKRTYLYHARPLANRVRATISQSNTASHINLANKPTRTPGWSSIQQRLTKIHNHRPRVTSSGYAIALTTSSSSSSSPSAVPPQPAGFPPLYVLRDFRAKPAASKDRPLQLSYGRVPLHSSPALVQPP